MHYQCSCPQCGKKVSRWYIFCEPTIYHRCRSCGARHRVSVTGWVVGFIPIGLALICLLMFERQIISWQIGVGFLVFVLALTIWLLPYFMPVRLESRTDQSHD